MCAMAGKGKDSKQNKHHAGASNGHNRSRCTMELLVRAKELAFAEIERIRETTGVRVSLGALVSETLIQRFDKNAATD